MMSSTLVPAGFPMRRSLAVGLACIICAGAGCSASEPPPSSGSSSRPTALKSPPEVTASGPKHDAAPRSDADFDGDGFFDVALGGGVATVRNGDNGVVLVVYGSPSGLNPERTQSWSETDFGGRITESFGDSLAVGDFDRDGRSDLAVGSPEAAAGAAGGSAGAVRVIYGSATGLGRSRTQRWTQDSPGVSGRAEPNDRFGAALAAANFGHGPQHDLVIGVHGEDRDAGSINILYGAATGLSARHDQVWSQASPGIADHPEKEDAFGATLVAGRFRSSGYTDLAVGVYNETVDGVYGAGAAHIINGSATGLTASRSRFWTQQSLSKRKPSAAAGFSFAMTTGRFTGGVTDDLAIGAPFANNNQGSVTIVYGSGTGLRPARTQEWSQASAGVAGRPEAEDGFGWSLTSGNFGRDEHHAFADLAIRVPGEPAGALDTGGALTIIYGGPGGLSPEGSQTLTQGFTSEATGVDISWLRQLTAIRSTSQGLDDLVVGDDDWVQILSPTGAGIGSARRWTTATLKHPEIWTGLADKVAG